MLVFFDITIFPDIFKLLLTVKLSNAYDILLFPDVLKYKLSIFKLSFITNPVGGPVDS